MMKKLILPKESIIVTEDETKNIEAGADSGRFPMIMDIFTMMLNRITTFIGSVFLDPIDVINRAIRNIFNPYTSSSIPIDEKNQRTSLM